MSKKPESAVKSLVVLSLICLVVTAALALTNGVTAPISEAAAAERATLARMEVMPDAADFSEVSTDGLESNVVDVYKADNDAGYVITTKVNGYGGDMTIMCGINNEGLITDTKVMADSETPTLGGKVKLDPYKGQYPGKDATLEGVDTISGSTISSRAYESAIHAAFDAYEQVKGAE